LDDIDLSDVSGVVVLLAAAALEVEMTCRVADWIVR